MAGADFGCHAGPGGRGKSAKVTPAICCSMRWVSFMPPNRPLPPQWKSRRPKTLRLVRLRANSSEFVELAGQIAAADERADRGAGNHVDADAGFVERAQDADMRPAAARAPPPSASATPGGGGGAIVGLTGGHLGGSANPSSDLRHACHATLPIQHHPLPCPPGIIAERACEFDEDSSLLNNKNLQAEAFGSLSASRPPFSGVTTR